MTGVSGPRLCARLSAAAAARTAATSAPVPRAAGWVGQGAGVQDRKRDRVTRKKDMRCNAARHLRKTGACEIAFPFRSGAQKCP